MRVAMIGSHGVGKSTLAEGVSKKTGLPVISEVAREIIKLAGYKSTEEYMQQSIEVIKDIQTDILVRQIWKETELGGFISDRSVIDIAAYTQYYTLDKWAGEMAVCWANVSYDLLVYVPITFPLKGDGFRSEDENMQFMIDDIIRESLEKVEVPLYEVRKGTIDERVQEVVERMRKL